MKKALTIFAVSLSYLGVFVVLWFLFSNLFGENIEPMLCFHLVLLAGVAIGLKLFALQFLNKTKKKLYVLSQRKYFVTTTIAIITLLAVAARLFFYFRFSYAPTSDAGSVFAAAQKVADGTGLAGNTYVAFFPYLASYDNILGAAMKLIGDPWLSTIILNTIIDIAATTLMYFLVKQVTKPKSKLPVIAFGAWILSPFNIILSVQSFQIITTNFFIIATILFTFLLSKKITVGKTATAIIFATLLGLSLGIGNCFRPILIIALLALVGFFAYLALTGTKKHLWLIGACFAIIVGLFFGIQKLNVALVSHQTGLEVATNSGGWAVFVGSNQTTGGKYNYPDTSLRQQICSFPLETENEKWEQDGGDTKLGQLPNDKCHAALQSAGIERYKKLGINDTFNLFVLKLHNFSGNQIAMSNNTSILGYASTNTNKLLNAWTLVYVIIILTLSIRFFYHHTRLTLIRQSIDPVILFIVIMMLGFFFSNILIESNTRYAQIMYPFFILFATLSLVPVVRKKMR